MKATAEGREHSKDKLLVKGPGLVVPEKDVEPQPRPCGPGTHVKRGSFSIRASFVKGGNSAG